MKQSSTQIASARLIVLIGLAAPPVLGQAREPKAPPRSVSGEQRSFSAEDDSVRRPMRLPEAVARALARDPDVEQILKSENLGPGQLPPSWFLTSEVHLGGPEERDVLVIGSGLLLGANVTTFWVFRPQPSGFALLLKAPAHDFVIKDSRSNGYRDIELVSATADRVSQVLCRFDGSGYRLSTWSPPKVP